LTVYATRNRSHKPSQEFTLTEKAFHYPPHTSLTTFPPLRWAKEHSQQSRLVHRSLPRDCDNVIWKEGFTKMTKRAAHQTPRKPPDHVATARQAGLEKGLFDELAKGLSYAVKSLRARKEQEHLTLLCEAEIAYQNALCLVREAGIIPGSPIAQSLQYLGTFLQKTNTLQEGN